MRQWFLNLDLVKVVTMIELKDVSMHRTFPVFERVSLKIPKGDFVYIIGESGSGKTSLIKLLTGEEKPSQGSVEVFGKNLKNLTNIGLQEIRKKIGIIFQDQRLIDELSVLDNICISLEITGIKDKTLSSHKDRIISDTLNILNLNKIADKNVSELSGGERQRVSIARALVRYPEIIIADEPTSGLDREHAMVVMDIFQKLHMRGTTVLIATHDREIVRKYRHRSCILKNGKIQIESSMSLV